MPALSRRTFCGLLLFAGLGPGLRPALAASTRVSTDDAGNAIQGYDTRAYWVADVARSGSDSFVVTWRGATWRFGTQAEADQFAAAPASYAPQFGGFCTRAMSLKKVVDGDPEVWRIFEGKLYLFARPVGLQVFNKGEAEMIAKAQAHWDTLG